MKGKTESTDLLAYLAKKNSLCIGCPKKVPFSKKKFGQGDTPILQFFLKTEKIPKKKFDPTQ